MRPPTDLPVIILTLATITGVLTPGGPMMTVPFPAALANPGAALVLPPGHGAP
jgi:hypothetical protein